MAQFTTLTSRAVPMPVNDIDTDQIIPARFLKVTDKTGLGENLFADWRYDANGAVRPDFVLHRPEHEGARILCAGDNFGCGSSREHAPWALTAFGFRAIISTSFADIFSNNALKNGLLPVQVPVHIQQRIFDIIAKNPAAELTIDLAEQTLLLPGGEEVGFPIDSFAKECLLNGVDELGYLLGFADRIAAYEHSA